MGKNSEADLPEVEAATTERGRGRGRPEGSQNKIPLAVKEMTLAALDQVGGVDYLAKQAVKNPVAFMALLGKILPMQVSATGDGKIAIQIMSYADAQEGDCAAERCTPPASDRAPSRANATLN